MEAKIIINCPDISKAELCLILQAIRDCEQKHFLDKRLFVWMDTKPELGVAEAQDILASIHPPWTHLEKI